MELNPERFAQRAPLPVMARRCWTGVSTPPSSTLGFEQVAQMQYTRSLLFSSVYELMTQ